MEENHLNEVAINFQYEYMKPGETIFSKGDIGEKYYIILKGKV
jgi:CRP-like cAMP-binding protein